MSRFFRTSTGVVYEMDDPVGDIAIDRRAQAIERRELVEVRAEQVAVVETVISHTSDGKPVIARTFVEIAPPAADELADEPADEPAPATRRGRKAAKAADDSPADEPADIDADEPADIDD